MKRAVNKFSTSASVHDDKLKEIIAHYKLEKPCNQELWIQHTIKQPNLKRAIEVAARCINGENKRHPHQYRIPLKVLEAAKDELLLITGKIKKAKTFDELYNLIQELNVYGFGKLTSYDVATRIGAYLGLSPDRIYLHAGTKVGATRLVGKTKKPYLLKPELPKPFQIKSLSCSEIEDILCIYKDEFKNWR